MKRIYGEWRGFFFKNCGCKIAGDGVDFEVPWLYNEALSDA